jgi:hypothetical protein
MQSHSEGFSNVLVHDGVALLVTLLKENGGELQLDVVADKFTYRWEEFNQHDQKDLFDAVITSAVNVEAVNLDKRKQTVYLQDVGERPPALRNWFETKVYREELETRWRDIAITLNDLDKDGKFSALQKLRELELQFQVLNWFENKPNILPNYEL